MDHRAILHWIAFCGFTYIFGYAGLYKIIRKPDMMEGMASLGFNGTWTLFIGTTEMLGVAGLLAGIFYPAVKNLAVLWLLPFAIGAFTMHMGHHHGPADYKESVICIVLAVVLLWTDRRFRIVI